MSQNKHECHKKVCENKDFCNVVMPSEDTKISEFNQCQKSCTSPFVIYAGLEYLKETQTFKVCETESYKYCIIIAGSKTKILKTHR